MYLRPNPKDGCDCKPVNQDMVLENVANTLKQFKIPTHAMKEIKEILKENFNAKKKHHNTYVDSLRREYQPISNKLDALMDMRLESSITTEEYVKKASSLKQRRVEIDSDMQQLTRTDNTFTETLISLLDLASKSYELFESLDQDEKRKIVNLIFPNLEISDKNLDKTTRKPLNYVVGIGESGKWLPVLHGIRTNSESRVRILQHKINYLQSNFLYRCAA